MFADVEAMVGFFLTTKLGEKVTTRVPNPRPDRFIRAWRSGGIASNRVLDVANVTVTAWALDTVSASDLARAAQHALLEDSSGMTLVRGSRIVGGMYYDPDPQTGTPRYTFTVELRVRRP